MTSEKSSGVDVDPQTLMALRRSVQALGYQQTMAALAQFITELKQKEMKRLREKYTGLDGQNMSVARTFPGLEAVLNVHSQEAITVALGMMASDEEGFVPLVPVPTTSLIGLEGLAWMVVHRFNGTVKSTGQYLDKLAAQKPAEEISVPLGAYYLVDVNLGGDYLKDGDLNKYEDQVIESGRTGLTIFEVLSLIWFNFKLLDYRRPIVALGDSVTGTLPLVCLEGTELAIYGVDDDQAAPESAFGNLIIPSCAARVQA